MVLLTSNYWDVSLARRNLLSDYLFFYSPLDLITVHKHADRVDSHKGHVYLDAPFNSHLGDKEDHLIYLNPGSLAVFAISTSEAKIQMAWTYIDGFLNQIPGYEIKSNGSNRDIHINGLKVSGTEMWEDASHCFNLISAIQFWNSDQINEKLGAKIVGECQKDPRMLIKLLSDEWEKL